MTAVLARGFVVAGQVQGVGFRWWARREAERLGLGGAIWNREDGAVEVHVVGPARGVDAFRAALDRGPPAARVERVEDTPWREDLATSQFRIVR
ncbi:MAG TPA: acylphosphatase [Longimicrobiales bacterium]|nr:acylphosphatase [Longimicrobiales bacterium]